MHSQPIPAFQTPIKPFHPIFPLLELKCSNLRDLQQIQGQLITTGFIHHSPSLTKFLSISLSLPSDTTSLAYACMVFNHTHQPNTVIWNTILRGLVQHNLANKAILAYVDMLQDPTTPPDRFTFPSLLKACTECMAFGEGTAMHGQILKMGLDSDLYTQTTLMSLYAACGDVVSARKVFDQMGQRKNKVVWTSMISGYVMNQYPREALLLFAMMEEEGLEIDEVTIATVVSACADLKDLEYGKRLHLRIQHSGMKICVILGTALVDLYAKCGYMEDARELFEAIPGKNVVAWSAIISGYAQNNQGEEALKLFKEMVTNTDHKPNKITIMAVLSACAQTGGLALHGLGEKALAEFSLMQKAGIQPDDITFIGVLSACSHGGLLQEGLNQFHDMREKFGITPKLEHYGCMADLLSRAGMLEEAEKFIQKMPMEPNGAVLGALLNGCRAHNNIELGEKAAKHLLEIEPQNDGVYVLLSNIFAKKKQWTNVKIVRNLMHQRGIKKTPGCSSIVIDGVTHTFTVGDQSHSEYEKIHSTMNYVNERLASAGHVAEISEVLLNIEEEEEKERSLSQHSEKLAVCFGLIKTKPGDEILILKNLRVCGDCHSAIKLISKLFHREITVRDRSRFHHFKDGSCSCKDYW